MDTHLSPAEIESFNQNGYFAPRRVFSIQETRAYRECLEELECRFADNPFKMRTDAHLIQRWAWDVVHDPRIVDPVSDLLGPNVLLWSLNWFIKEPRDQKIVTFHQDATYWGLEPHDVVTAWVALSDASEATGPMQFVSGSHLEEIRQHKDTFASNNLLSRGQAIEGDIDEKRVVSAPLRAGEMSLHHVRLIHGSQPNETDDRRIGMVLRYCATHVRQTKIDDTAVLVKGEDTYQHFELLPQPENEFGEIELTRHADATRRMSLAIHSKDHQ